MKDDTIQTREASVLHGLAWLMGALGLVVALYLSLPLVAGRIPWSFERRWFGELRLFPETQECSENPEALQAFRSIVSRIYPISPGDREFSVTPTVIRKEEANALTFLAGRIFVYDGLIQEAESPEELAAVLAHEIEHVRRRHVENGLIEKGMTILATSVAFPGSSAGLAPSLIHLAATLTYNRAQEEQADEGALERLRDAQISIDGFKAFFGRRKTSEKYTTLISDHPSDQSRFDRVSRFPTFKSREILTHSEWTELKKICRSRK